MVIYFDNAATTAVKPEVLEAMLPFFKDCYGNPSSIFYSKGREAGEEVAKARKTIAGCLGCKDTEIFFTSCGSEADNWAIKGIAQAYKSRGKNKIITSQIEHHAVINTCKFLEKNGFEVVYLPVDEYGTVSADALREAVDDKTALVSVMYANNEIGTIEPIEELCKIAHEVGALFHTDAVQAVGAVPIDVKKLGVDMLSLSGHKFHAPKGIGALYVRTGIRPENLIHGGMQEKGRRAGTENTAYIVGLAKALEIAVSTMEEKTARVTAIRDKIIKGITETIPYVNLNGHPQNRLPGNVNFSFKYIEGESLLLWLDINGIAVSSGSACASDSLDPSHVLLATGLPHEIAHGSLRISIGDENTEEEADKLLEVLPGIVQRLREMSPLYENVEKE